MKGKCVGFWIPFSLSPETVLSVSRRLVGDGMMAGGELMLAAQGREEGCLGGVIAKES
jgi:hypothetical protein